MSLIGIFYAAIVMIYYFYARRRIPLAAAVLETSLDAINSYRNVFIVLAVSFVVQMAWFVVFAFFVMANDVYLSNNGFVAFLAVVSFFWTNIGVWMCVLLESDSLTS